MCKRFKYSCMKHFVSESVLAGFFGTQTMIITSDHKAPSACRLFFRQLFNFRFNSVLLPAFTVATCISERSVLRRLVLSISHVHDLTHSYTPHEVWFSRCKLQRRSTTKIVSSILDPSFNHHMQYAIFMHLYSQRC
jgi:hypothetical protein